MVKVLIIFDVNKPIPMIMIDGVEKTGLFYSREMIVEPKDHMFT
jgi:hypothetical protein